MATERVPGPTRHHKTHSTGRRPSSIHRSASQVRHTASQALNKGVVPTPLSKMENFLHLFFPTLFPLPFKLEMQLNAAMLLPAPNPTAPQISSADYQAVAADLGIEVAAIQAVAEVEAGSRKKGFDDKGRPIILFEGRWFHKFTNGQFDSNYPQLSSPTWDAAKKYYSMDQWDRMYQAMMLDYESAWKSASWGMFQVMGFNHSGSSTVDDFVKAMFRSEGEHLRSFAAFCKDNNLVSALKSKDWAAFAKGYNGAGYAENHYDTNIEKAYNKYAKANNQQNGAPKK